LDVNVREHMAKTPTKTTVEITVKTPEKRSVKNPRGKTYFKIPITQPF
jgi:hypothetical protein